MSLEKYIKIGTDLDREQEIKSHRQTAFTVLGSRNPDDFLLFDTSNILRSYLLIIKLHENNQPFVPQGLVPPLRKMLFQPGFIFVF